MTLAVERLLRAPTQRRADRNKVLRFAGERIGSIEDSADAKGLLALPALANAHDHARAVKPAALGALDLPLELWLAAITGAPRVEPYVIGAVSLARSALGGAGSVMMHYMRAQGGMSLVDEAREIARAARDVGVRIAFSVVQRDRNWIAYGDDEKTLGLVDQADRDAVKSRLVPKSLPPQEQVALVDEIAAAVEGGLVSVQFGPAGVQWCSDALLRAVAERSAETGRRIHMHLLETKYQREWADRAHPQGLVKHLDALGLLSPRLSLSVQNSSNLGLRSGLAPVREMLRAGVKVAIGLDGVGLDDDDDALRELRLAQFLHGGVGFEQWLDGPTLLHAACDTGRRAVTGID
jgi:5-methylthioadenosine/S-adenosylhomocysteine deaminase